MQEKKSENKKSKGRRNLLSKVQNLLISDVQYLIRGSKTKKEEKEKKKKGQNEEELTFESPKSIHLGVQRKR